MPTRGKISRSEWSEIVRRRTAGETYAAIARDYGCSAPAIRYILEQWRLRSTETSYTAISRTTGLRRLRAGREAPSRAGATNAAMQSLRGAISSDIALFLVVFDSALVEPFPENVERLLDATDRLMRAAARIRIELQSLSLEGRPIS